MIVFMKRVIFNSVFIILLALCGNTASAQIDTNSHTVIPWHPINDTDLAWKKRVWREIPVYEKRNAALRDDPHIPQKNVLANILLAGINEGAFTAYAENSSELRHPLTKEEINALISCDPASLSVNAMKFWSFCLEHKNDSEEFTVESNGTDSNQVSLSNSTAGITSCSYPQQIDRYRIAEDWLFDKGHGQMTVRIVAIAPLVQNKPLFWLSYPDIRKYLARYEAYKVAKSRRYTWDEYFESRQFSSKIIKVGEPVGRGSK